VSILAIFFCLSGGRFSSASVPGYIDIEQKRASSIPGPGHYTFQEKMPVCDFVNRETGERVVWLQSGHYAATHAGAFA